MPAPESTAPAVAGTTVVVSPQGGYVAKHRPCRVHNDNDDTCDDTLKEPNTDATEERMAEGNRFEEEVGADLIGALGMFVCDTPAIDKVLRSKRTDKTKLARLTDMLAGHKAIAFPVRDRTDEWKAAWTLLTLAAMAAGADFIWNARLPADLNGPRIGEPDFLIGVETVDGVRRYLPGDVKHHRETNGTAKEHARLVSTFQQPGYDDAVSTVVGPGYPALVDVMQLAHYHRMLEALGLASAKPRGAVIGKERRLLWCDLNEEVYRHLDPELERKRNMSALGIYDLDFKHNVSVIQRALERNAGAWDLAPLAEPEWDSPVCSECPWRTFCHDQLTLDRHITLLPGITPPRARAHYARNVRKIEDLARLDTRTAAAVDAGLDVPGLIGLARSVDPTLSLEALIGMLGGRKTVTAAVIADMANLGTKTAGDVALMDDTTASYAGTDVWQLLNSIDQARVYIKQRVHRARGVDSVTLPNPAIALHFDVENDADFVYLIGVLAHGHKKQRGEYKVWDEFRPCVTWENTPDAEAAVFAEFWELLVYYQQRAKKGKYSLALFHYGDHERSTFRKLAGRHAGKPGVPSLADVEALFDSATCIDLYKVLSKQLIWPTPSQGLKDVAKYIKFVWRDEAPGGGNSIAWYRDALRAAAEGDDEQAQLGRQRVLDYNEDDVRATAKVVDWLHILGDTRQPGKRLPSVLDLEKTYGRRIIRPRITAV